MLVGTSYKKLDQRRLKQGKSEGVPQPRAAEVAWQASRGAPWMGSLNRKGPKRKNPRKNES